MASYAKAITIQPKSHSADGAIFEGAVDGRWSVAAVPQGGYALSLIIESCIQYQRQMSSPHVDPIHVTAHFLKSSTVGSFQTRVRTVRTGKGFSNIVSELLQDDQVRVSAHLIFGILGSSDRDSHPQPRGTLVPGMLHARRVPLHSHPATARETAVPPRWKYAPLIQFAKDPVILARNKSDGPNPGGTKREVGGGGTEWGTWFNFREEEERLTTPMLAFLADLMANLPELLSDEEWDVKAPKWFPTVVMTLEFKAPIPPASSPYHSSRAVGIYSTGKFMNDPSARHDAYVEVWTAPTCIGEGHETDGWRDKQVCLATSTQMALCIPIEVNHRKAKL